MYNVDHEFTLTKYVGDRKFTARYLGWRYEVDEWFEGNRYRNLHEGLHHPSESIGDFVEKVYQIIEKDTGAKIR